MSVVSSRFGLLIVLLDSCVLIDCGKTFARDACEWFPKHNLRRINGESGSLSWNAY